MCKIVIGASRADTEKVLGTAAKFVNEDAGFLQVYKACYYAKEIKMEYDPQTKFPNDIWLFGEIGKTEAFVKYRLFPGVTYKGIPWGASPD
jgi:hypothetical protein